MAADLAVQQSPWCRRQTAGLTLNWPGNGGSASESPRGCNGDP